MTFCLQIIFAFHAILIQYFYAVTIKQLNVVLMILWKSYIWYHFVDTIFINESEYILR